MSTLDITLNTINRVAQSLLNPQSTDSISDIVLEGIEERYSYVKYILITILILLIFVLLFSSIALGYMTYDQYVAPEEIIDTEGNHKFSKDSMYNYDTMTQLNDIIEELFVELNNKNIDAVLLGIKIDTIEPEYDRTYPTNLNYEQNNELLYTLARDGWLSYSNPSRLILSSKNNSNNVNVDIFVDYDKYDVVNTNDIETFTSLDGLELNGISNLNDIDTGKSSFEINEIKTKINTRINTGINKIGLDNIINIFDSYTRTIYDSNTGSTININIRLHVYKYDMVNNVYYYIDTVGSIINDNNNNYYGKTLNLTGTKLGNSNVTIPKITQSKSTDYKSNLIIYSNSNRLDSNKIDPKFNVHMYNYKDVYVYSKLNMNKYKSIISKLNESSRRTIYALAMLYSIGGVHVSSKKCCDEYDMSILDNSEYYVGDDYVMARVGSYAIYDALTVIFDTLDSINVNNKDINVINKMTSNVNFDIKSLLNYVS